MARVINVPGFRFLQICVLRCGATALKEPRHILKRFIRCFLSVNPIRVHGIAIDVNILLLLANTLCIAWRLDTAFKKADFMSIPNALLVIDCMTEIACADFTDLDPSRRAQAEAVRQLHWPVYYARK